MDISLVMLRVYSIPPYTCILVATAETFEEIAREKNNSTEDFLRIIVNLSRYKENEIVENEDEKFEKRRRRGFNGIEKIV